MDTPTSKSADKSTRSGGHPASNGASAAASVPPDAVLVQRTMAEIAPVADEVISYFYALLFSRHPGVRAMFPPA
ncbi:flavohemoprotein, partial [Streptomyces sp. NPDC006283]